MTAAAGAGESSARSVHRWKLLLAERDQVETARLYVEALRDYWLVRAQAEQLRSGRLAPGAAALSTDVAASSGAPAQH